jgi:hypothetical protein
MDPRFMDLIGVHSGPPARSAVAGEVPGAKIANDLTPGRGCICIASNPMVAIENRQAAGSRSLGFMSGL